jgi:polysaccharide biosynthesis/export protein
MKRISISTFWLVAVLVVTQQVFCEQPDSTSSFNYLLGPNDLIALVVPALAENFNNRSFRIDGNGDVALPVIGNIHAGGYTTRELQDVVKEKLRHILQSPDVVINVSEFSSQPVSVLGAVTQPGIRQLAGRKSLFEVLSLCGGLRADAGTTIEITRDLTRGMIPLPGTKLSATAKSSIAIVNVKDITDASAENIGILPGDTVFIPKASIVYAVGSVTRPGGYPIGEDGVLSALQVVSLAGGFQKSAATEKARILRLTPGSTASRTEITINIKQLMAGKLPDVPLQANDILFIPNSSAKSAGFRTLEAIVTVATGLTVYGRL